MALCGDLQIDDQSLGPSYFKIKIYQEKRRIGQYDGLLSQLLRSLPCLKVV